MMLRVLAPRLDRARRGRAPTAGFGAWWLALVALLAVTPVGAAQGFAGYGAGGGNEARGTLYSRVDGDVVRAAISIEVSSGWYLYHTDLGHPDAIGKPARVTLEGAGITWGEVQFPEPKRKDQVGLDAWAYTHAGTVVLYAAGELAEGADGSDVSAILSGQTCSESGTCILYDEELTSAGAGPDAVFEGFPAALVAALGDGSGPSIPVEPSGGDEVEPTRPATNVDYGAVTFPEFAPQIERPTHGLGVWLLLAFLAGIILNVMPCVLPVISIKVLSFVQQAGEDRRRIMALGLSFAAGIVVVFIGLATLAATLGLSWGEQFQNQGFLIGMIGIVFAFALSMFGVFDLGVPSGVGSMAGPNREGLGDAFFKGMLATVLATPCSGPFLGSTLTWALAQPALVVFSIFLSLGLGMAAPYVLLTANPALLKLVPRPGPWMETFKHAMGFVLLATVVYLMISLRQDLLLFTVAFLVFVGAACWMWGRFTSYDQSRGRRWALLGLALLVTAGGAGFSFGTFRGLFDVSVDGSDEHGWIDFDPVAFERDLDAGRSVLVDFTADWCPNCKYNEKFVYESDEVLEVVGEKRVVRYKADITHDDARTDMIERLMLGLGARSIPFLAIFPGDAPLQPHVRFDIVGQDDVLAILDTLPDPDVSRDTASL